MDVTELFIQLARIAAFLIAAGVSAVCCAVLAFVYLPVGCPAPRRGDPKYWRATLLPALAGAATAGLLFAAFYVLDIIGLVVEVALLAACIVAAWALGLVAFALTMSANGVAAAAPASARERLSRWLDGVGAIVAAIVTVGSLLAAVLIFWGLPMVIKGLLLVAGYVLWRWVLPWVFGW